MPYNEQTLNKIYRVFRDFAERFAGNRLDFVVVPSANRC